MHHYGPISDPWLLWFNLNDEVAYSTLSDDHDRIGC